MAEMKMGVVESHFADIIWANEPLHSRELVKALRKRTELESLHHIYGVTQAL